MEYQPNALFQTPHHLYEFSASGYIMGSFLSNFDEAQKGYIPGSFVTEEGEELIASIKNKNWQNLTQRNSFSPEAQLYWRVYFRTTRSGKLTKIDLIRPKRNLENLKESFVQEDLSEITDVFLIRGRIQTILEKEFLVRLERNEKPPKGKENSFLWKPFYLTIQGNLPLEATTEEFWEIFCIRDGDYLRLKKAQLITEEMTKSFEQYSSTNTQKNQGVSNQNKTVNQSPYKLSAKTNSILKPNSINSVMISEANSILVLYWSSGFNVPLGLKTLNIKGNVIFS